MRPANINDKDLVVQIINSTFYKNPGFNWMFRSGKNHQKQITRLATYAFYKAFYCNGVYISSNGKGVALCYKYNTKTRSLIPFLYQMIFALTSVRLMSIPKILKLEAYKRKQRPASGEFLYFWLFGVLKGGEDAGFELKNGIFDIAIQQNLPIYAETSVERNKFVYERYGLETYNLYEDKEENLKYWFLKWENHKDSKEI